MWLGIITRKFLISIFTEKPHFSIEFYRNTIFLFLFYLFRANATVRTIRTIKKGEEILDNYGYHYAVMPREERQRKL